MKSAACSPPDEATSIGCCSDASTRTFYAFDMLSVNGEDICGLPLIERKRRLRRIMPKVDTRLLYLDSIAERGRGSVSGCGRGSG